MNSIDHRNRTISISSDDDDDTGNIGFFETLDRIPSGITVSFVSSGSDCDEDELSRLSFVSAIAPPIELQCFENSEFPDFDVWISEPSSIKDRRKKLFQGLGLANDKKKPRSESINNKSPVPEIDIAERTSKICHQSSSSKVIIRSKSDVTVERNAVHNVVLFRSASSPSFLCGSDDSRQIFRTDPLTRSRIKGRRTSSPVGLCKIKNLDTGTEFIVDEYREDGMWNRLSELQTGKQLTMEEFEKNVGYSPIVKELMRREQVKEENNMNSIGSDLKCGKSSKKKGSWLKNIKGVANSVTGFMVDKERDSVMERTSKNLSSSSEWMRVRRHGKPYKEFTGLYMCQEIRAHEGSIWSIRFSHDARYLASAGEDRVIHVWEVVERDVHGNSESLAPIASDSPDRANITECQSPEKKKKGKTGRKSSIPDHVVVPDSVFALSEKPVCSFQGHLDDILDLSWSKSYHLLSSSMDKTVRLWNMETKSCLKLFAHNDYVTCIQFNPMDDRYFISGSLDAKVRIWSIPDHQVVDWSDLHEMVTAACYTPDGQGALVGSHKGYCRLYDTSDSKLHQRGQIECKSKRKKSCAKKITGFQFTPGNPSEVLITSADSQIRVYNGIDIVQKFRGFRNTNSQISASYTSDGKYVVCASEDSHVYIWKREECQTIGANGKNKVSMTVRSHEHFQCRDVSVAIPWPGGFEKCELPIMPLRARRPSRCHQSGRYNLQPPPPSSGPSNLEIGNSWRNTNYRDDDIAIISSHSDSNGGSSSGGSNSSSSFTSASSILSAGLSSVLSSVGSASSYWGGGGGGNNSSSIEVSTAWGLVVVTAGLGGEIRTYQNFGLPLRLNRQSTLF